MTPEEMLTKALQAQSENGPQSKVEVHIPRLPSKARYLKQIRISPKRGPWGQIVALTPSGTLAVFEAGKLIAYLAPLQTVQPRPTQLASWDEGRVKVHPWISKSVAEMVSTLAESQSISISAIMDAALKEYCQRYA